MMKQIQYRRLVLTVIISAAILSKAWAQNAVDLQVITDVVQGQGQAGIMLIVNEDVLNVELTFGSPQGERTIRSGALTAGDRKLLAMRSDVGRASYSGRLLIRFLNGEIGEMPLQFDLNVIAGLEVSVPEAEVDLKGKKLALKASRPVAKVSYLIVSETGERLDEGEGSLSSDDPLAAVVAWGGKAGRIIRIDLTVTDTKGTFAKLALSPWSVDVAHEEVNFASGSAEIPAAEAPKLDRAYEELMAAVKRYGGLIKLNLYIVGYTDTVGGKAYNLELSNKRARSIAAYLLKKGFGFPIYYQGFGEEVLAVPTPDEFDAAPNRRALYLLGGDFRPTGPQIPRADWKVLR